MKSIRLTSKRRSDEIFVVSIQGNNIIVLTEDGASALRKTNSALYDEYISKDVQQKNGNVYLKLKDSISIESSK